jgi:hypothetical protein
MEEIKEDLIDQKEQTKSEEPEVEESVQKNPTAKLFCKLHNVDAEYFSSQKNSYVCYQCLVEGEGLIQVTEQHKKFMNDFDQIRTLTMDAILKHRKTGNTLKNWK